jgi:hypothetical protein
MKFTAALVALAAALAAPLAAADCTTANDAVLDKLDITSTIKRTKVNGGGRIVQTIKVKNTATTDAEGLKLWSFYNDDDNELIKGTARVPGAKAMAIKPDGSLPPLGLAVSSGATTFTLKAGKTLKATIAWKADRCPDADDNVFKWGPGAISIPTDTAAGLCAKLGGDQVDVRFDKHRKGNACKIP